MRLLFTGNSTKIGQACWNSAAYGERVNYSKSNGWDLIHTHRVDELLNEPFDVIVSVTLVNQYYLIEKFFEEYRYTNKRLFVIGSRASDWAGRSIPHHGMKYAIDKKTVYDAVRYIQNEPDKKCTAQIINIGKADAVEKNLPKHFSYMMKNPDVLEMSVW